MVSFGRDVNNDCTYTMLHNEQCTSISREDVVSDLGVMFDEKLNFREHIHCKINMAYEMVEIIKRNFKYLSISSFVLVYKNLVRSHLNYCNRVWNPYRKTDIETFLKVQKKATKIQPKLSHLIYSDRLKNVTYLHYIIVV